MNPEVVGIGGCFADCLGIFPGLPLLDTKTPITSWSWQGGGPVGTALVTLARLGVATAMIGKVSDDLIGSFARDEFARDRVDASYIIVEPGQSSPLSMILVDEHTGKRTILYSTGTVKPLKREEIPEKLITNAKFLHLEGGVQWEAELQGAKLAKKAGVTVVYDAERLRPETEELLAYVDILITSKEFAEEYTASPPEKALDKLFSRGFKLVGITLGDQGCLCKTSEESFHIPAFQVKVVDTTGAGDVFHGAFTYGLLKGWDARKTAEFATAVAGIKCQSLGGRKGIPNLEHTLNFIKKRKT
jgi:ribokinase